MKSVTKLLATFSRWMFAALFCVSVSTLVWQGGFFLSPAAMAAPGTTVIATPVIATTNTGDQIQRDNKNFVQDAAEKVKETAKDNAERVGQATGNDGSYIQRKAQRDAARIEERANEDATRTKKAIDKNVNAIERTVDNIKDAFSN